MPNKTFNKENAKEKVKSILSSYNNTIHTLYKHSIWLSQFVPSIGDANNLNQEEQVQLLYIIFSETKSLFLDMNDEDIDDYQFDDDTNQYLSYIEALDNFKLFMIDSIDSRYKDREVA